MQALRTAATGMAAQQMNVEVISNNIANMNTVGYKKQRAEFQDLLYQTIEQAGAQSSDQGTIVPTGIQIGAGVKTASGTPTTGTPGQAGFGQLMQGYTEASNVDPVTEITALIVAQRAYEMNSKVISTADNMLGVANQVKS